jgi:hypothetical protein
MNQHEDDEIVAEVRRARDRIFRDSGGTLDGLYARLNELEERETRQLVSPEPRRTARLETKAS